jgi:hypothetical protein
MPQNCGVILIPSAFVVGSIAGFLHSTGIDRFDAYAAIKILGMESGMMLRSLFYLI